MTAVSSAPLDVVYLFRHSAAGDLELRYSLRSVAANLTFVRKVWIFGDRPAFLARDRTLVEHVEHDYLAPLCGWRTPVRNDFLMLLLASLIPGLAFDFVRFSDDYIVLQPLPRSSLCTVRALEDLNRLTERGRGVWKDMLWRTYDILKRAGYPGYNFESHVPQPLTRQLVLEAFFAFREFLSEDRFGGLQSGTAIYNFAVLHQALPFVWIGDEQSKAGFYGVCPAVNEIEAACRGKLFLSFDDEAFGPSLSAFLQEKFPAPCQYEDRR